MTEYVRGMVIPQVADVHEWFQRCLADAERKMAELRGTPMERVLRHLVDDITLAYKTFNTNLKEAAEIASTAATKMMQEKLEQHERPAARSGRPPATELAVARPLGARGNLETGMVGVGDIMLLQRLANPDTGYGTFWRALEYGTGADGVPSQVGRVILGVFSGAGGSNPTRPDPQYSGGRGQHPVFRSKTRLSGSDRSAAGFGTIGMEMKGKHFIETGYNIAVVKWREDIAAAQERAIRALSEISL